MSSGTESLARAVKEQEDGLLNCVHCGFCLPACPTYRRLGDEADSPRGRLHLMRAVVEGRLDAGSDAFQLHIDRCLGCRACEPVCPSGVAYGHLLELARHVGSEARRPPLLSRLLLRVFGTSALARPAMALARLLRATGIPALAARSWPAKGPPGPVRLGMAMLAATAPAPALPGIRTATTASRAGGASSTRVPPPTAPHRPAPPTPALPTTPTTPAHPATPQPHPGTVAILAGCVQAGLFSRVNTATERVLRANGYDVVRVPGQGCCGALHSHAGDLDAARTLARRNVDAFEAVEADFIVMNASGCGAAMSAYGSLLSRGGKTGTSAEAVAARVRDVSELLAAQGPRRGGKVNLKITFDPPCHLLHAQGVSRPPEQVLRAVPGLEVVPLPGAGECCGGAGIYGLTQRDLGSRIGGDKVRSVIGTGAGALVTANPGCMMQIGAGLRMAGRRTPVLHLVELLDESYRRGGIYDADSRTGDPAAGGPRS
ncbi:MAG: heterodisulfide reductase-related iron-sulfur binding cluster [Gemmatimonadota bacterium]|nr:heterodisulfide reductase-related iron-sulfur binding cluster [Gemmatimonadota bacterium]